MRLQAASARPSYGHPLTPRGPARLPRAIFLAPAHPIHASSASFRSGKDEDPSWFGAIAMGVVVVLYFLRLGPPAFICLAMLMMLQTGSSKVGSYELLALVCVAGRS